MFFINKASVMHFIDNNKLKALNIKNVGVNLYFKTNKDFSLHNQYRLNRGLKYLTKKYYLFNNSTVATVLKPVCSNDESVLDPILADTR